MVSKSVWKLSEILAIDADVKHVEGILVIKVRNIRYLTCDGLIIVDSLGAKPV